MGTAMRGKDGKLNHAAMKLGDDFIMMGYPGPKYKSPRRLGQAAQHLYVNVNDVDKHFARAKKAGAKVWCEGP
jgi:PhnB protein